MKYKKQIIVALIGAIVGYGYYEWAYIKAVNEESIKNSPLIPILFFAIIGFVFTNEYINKKKKKDIAQ
jgi:H+/Cl- antiporter ClcA